MAKEEPTVDPRVLALQKKASSDLEALARNPKTEYQDRAAAFHVLVRRDPDCGFERFKDLLSAKAKTPDSNLFNAFLSALTLGFQDRELRPKDLGTVAGYLDRIRRNAEPYHASDAINLMGHLGAVEGKLQVPLPDGKTQPVLSYLKEAFEDEKLDKRTAAFALMRLKGGEGRTHLAGVLTARAHILDDPAAQAVINAFVHATDAESDLIRLLENHGDKTEARSKLLWAIRDNQFRAEKPLSPALKGVVSRILLADEKKVDRQTRLSAMQLLTAPRSGFTREEAVDLALANLARDPEEAFRILDAWVGDKPLKISHGPLAGKTLSFADFCHQIAADTKLSMEVRENAIRRLQGSDSDKIFEFLSTLARDPGTSAPLRQIALRGATIGTGKKGEELAVEIARNSKNDPELRIATIGLIAGSRAREAAIALQDVLATLPEHDPKRNWRTDREIRSLAKLYTRPENLDLLKDLAPNNQLRTGLVALRDTKTPPLDPKVTDAIDAWLDQPAKAAKARGEKIDPCTVPCSIVDTFSKWSDEKYEKGTEFVGDKALWIFTKRALAAVFLSRALPLCPKAEKPLAEVRRWLLDQKGLPEDRREPKKSVGSPSELNYLMKALEDAGVAPDDPHLKKARAFADAAGGDKEGGDQPPRLAGHIAPYAAQYASAYLRTLIATLPPESPDRVKAERLLAQVQAPLNLFLSESHKLERDLAGNSFFNAYALSTSIIHSQAPPLQALADLARLDETAKDPATAPYRAGHGPATVGGGIARAITIQFTRFLQTPSPSEKADAVEKFASLLDRLSKPLPGDKRTPMNQLNQHQGNEDVHLGDDGVACYYLQPNFLYWTSGLATMLQDPTIDKKQRTQLEGMRARLRSDLVALLGKDGLFRPWGKDTYSNSPAYLNPMSALALLPLLEGCRQPDGKIFGPSLGIIDPELLKVKQRQAERLPGSLNATRKAVELKHAVEELGKKATDWLFPPKKKKDHGTSVL